MEHIPGGRCLKNMRRLCLLLFLALALPAQDKPPEKPDPVKKARELLDAAAEMMGGVQPQIQVIGLWHLAENYQAFDRKKALEWYRQAWAGTPSLPAEQVAAFEKRLQVDIIRSVADLDPDTAIEICKQIKPPKANSYDNRLWAIVKIVQVLLDKQQYDKAIQFLDAMGGLGVYSYSGASMIFGKLPADDSRRLFLFGSAQAAFNLHPNTEFGQLLARHWKDVPPNMAGAALRSFLGFILDRKEESGAPYQSTTFVSAKGTATFNTRQERELFDVMWIVREIEPKRAEEILQQYPNLKAAVEAYPKGTVSMQAMYTYTATTGKNDLNAQRFAEQFRMRHYAGPRHGGHEPGHQRPRQGPGDGALHRHACQTGRGFERHRARGGGERPRPSPQRHQ